MSVAAVLPGTASASERHWGWTYETGVLNPGKIEIEPQTTLRVGKASHYIAFDQRFEFEFGVAKGLQSAIYVNLGGLTRAEGDALVSEASFDGISSEWKLKILDSVADPVGMGAYLEVGMGPEEFEVEAKYLLDKQVGRFLFALNVVGEFELEFEAPGEVVPEVALEFDLAIGGAPTDGFSVGLEVRERTQFVDGGVEYSVLWAGPSVSFRHERWWAGISVLPQLVALAGRNDRVWDLDHNQRVSARLILGFEL